MWAALLGVAIAIIVFAAWAYSYGGEVEPNRIMVPYYTLWSPHLPPELDGIVLCQVSDTHITGEPRNKATIAKALQSVKADLYLLTGDMIHRQPGIAGFFTWFDQLGDKITPAVAVLGNAEHKSFVRKQEVLDGLSQRSVPLLNNESMLLPCRGTHLQIVGVDDPHTYHSDFVTAYRDVDSSLFTILLCHSPDGARERVGMRADLMLCGHTHGGAIRLPVVGALVHGTTHLKGLVSGWYSGRYLSRRSRFDTGDTQLYVSRGLGMSGWRWRLNCLPELPVITLRKGNSVRVETERVEKVWTR